MTFPSAPSPRSTRWGMRSLAAAGCALTSLTMFAGAASAAAPPPRTRRRHPHRRLRRHRARSGRPEGRSSGEEHQGQEPADRRPGIALHHRERDPGTKGLGAAGRLAPADHRTGHRRRAAGLRRHRRTGAGRHRQADGRPGPVHRGQRLVSDQDTYGHGTHLAGIIAAHDPVTLTSGVISALSPLGSARSRARREARGTQARHDRRQHRRQPGHRRARLGQRTPDDARRHAHPGRQPGLRNRLHPGLHVRPAGGRSRTPGGTAWSSSSPAATKARMRDG